MDEQHPREGSAVLRSIAWRDLCPWLLLFRCPQIALRSEVLLLATAGGILTAAAWWLSGLIFYFGSLADKEKEYPNIQAAAVADFHTEMCRIPGSQAGAQSAESLQRPPFGKYVWHEITGGRTDGEPVHTTWRLFTKPYIQLLSLEATLQQFAYLLFGALSTLLIWSLFGGAITRYAAMQLAHDERIGLTKSLKFAAGKIMSYFASPLLPLLGLSLFALGVFLFVGLPMNLDVGLIWSGLVWILVLACGLFVGVLLLGLLFGWPLMWATISTEGTDAFDALSRTYAYTLQRPLHYLLYIVLVGVLGALTWLLVLGFAEAVIHVSWWSADWAVFDEDRMEAIIAAADGDQVKAKRLAEEGVEITKVGGAGIWLFRVANGFVRAIAYSFAFGYFWVAACAIYLLLRREVDHTETDEIYLDDDSDSYGLPPLKEDEAGVPVVDDAAASSTDVEGDASEE